MPAKKELVKVRMFKMTFDSKKFNKNQIVWIQKATGAMAARVTGKFRGNGRYISAWVTWDGGNKDFPSIKTIDVESMFAKRRQLELAH